MNKDIEKLLRAIQIFVFWIILTIGNATLFILKAIRPEGSINVAAMIFFIVFSLVFLFCSYKEE